MGKSLQDQLLKSGLVDEKQAKKIHAGKRKKNKQQRQSRTAIESESRRQIEKRQAEKKLRDRELNRQRAEEAGQKAKAAQVRQMIERNRQSRGDEEVAFNFNDLGKVKRIWVSEPVRKKLSNGQLAIVKLGADYELVNTEMVEKIRIRSEKSVIFHNTTSDGQDKDDHADPDYENYPVPDDLIW